jgi:hypothetical protein
VGSPSRPPDRLYVVNYSFSNDSKGFRDQRFRFSVAAKHNHRAFLKKKTCNPKDNADFFESLQHWSPGKSKGWE